MDQPNLPPAAVLRRLALASYFSVASLSVFIYDALVNLAIDYDLIKKRGINVASAIYFTSRISTLGFVLVSTLELVQPMDECHSLKAASFVFYILFETSTLLLSCIRVYAVWKRSNRVVAIFGLLWITAVAGCCTIVTGSDMDKVQGFCVEYVVHPYLAASLILPTVNHCIVIVAITIGLCRHHGSSSIKLYVLGDALPAFSKAILQSSQICYVIAAISGITTVIWFYAFHSDPSYRIVLIPVYTTVVNIMYSWVFRKAKQGIFTAIAPKSIDPTIFNSVPELLRPTRHWHAPFPQPKTSNGIRCLAPGRSSSIQTFEGSTVDLGHRYSLEASTPVNMEVEKVVSEYESDLSAVERGILR